MNRNLSSGNSESSFNSRPSSAGNNPASTSRLEDQAVVDSKNSRIAQRKGRIEAARQAKLKPQNAAGNLSMKLLNSEVSCKIAFFTRDGKEKDEKHYPGN